MNRFIYYTLIAGSLFCTACSNDDDASNDVVNFDSAVVKDAPDFTDPRDNTTYKCVQIGNQIWLAENLRYQIPGHATSGCYTWEEKQEEFSLDNVPEENKAVYEKKVTLKDVVDLLAELIADPKYEVYTWYEGASTLISNFVNYPMMLMGWTKQDLIDYFCEGYSPFDRDLKAAYNKRVEEVITNTPGAMEELALIASENNFKKAEEDNGYYSKEYGLLYSYEGASAAAAKLPEGWRVPTDEDWKKLEQTLGMSAEDLEKMEDWRGAGMATLLSEGGESKFNAKRAGGNIYLKANTYKYVNKGQSWYFWSSTQYQENDSTSVAMIRMSAPYTDKVWRGTSRLSNGYQDMLYSVRLVKDAN